MKEQAFAVLQPIEPASKQAITPRRSTRLSRPCSRSPSRWTLEPPCFWLRRFGTAAFLRPPERAVWLRAEKQCWLPGVSLRPLGINKLRWGNETSPCSCLPGEHHRTPRPAGIAACTRATGHSCISQGVGRLGLALKTLSTDHFPTGTAQNCPRAVVADKPVAGLSGGTIWSCRSSAGHREASTARHALKGLHRQEWTPDERRPDCCDEKWLSSN